MLLLSCEMVSAVTEERRVRYEEVVTIMHSTNAFSLHTHSPDRLQLRHSSRAVRVVVLDGRVEVDSFEATDPKVLQAALHPILEHLTSSERLLFLGTEEASLPLGIDRVRRIVDLSTLDSALLYLAA